MCHLHRSTESPRQMEEAHLWDVSVGQNVLKINAWHRWHWVIQSWTALAIGTSSADREQLPSTNHSGLHRKGLLSELFTETGGGRAPATSHPEKGVQLLCQCLEDQQTAVHFHRRQISTTFQRCCYKIAPVGSFHNERVRANPVLLKFLSPPARVWAEEALHAKA